MPIYEYKCDDCEGLHEAIQKFDDPQLTECPACGGKLTKMISNTSFVLKGSGWYVTDYASGDRKKAMDKDKSESSGKPSKSDKPSSSDKSSSADKPSGSEKLKAKEKSASE